MRSLDQVEDLHPVSVLQAVLPQVLDELDDEARLLDLRVHHLGQRLALSENELVLRQLLLEVPDHFVDGLDDELDIQAEERCVVAHLPSLLPVEQDLPEADGVLVHLLQVLEVAGTRELVLLHLLLGVRLVLVEQLEELPVQDDLGPDLVDGLRPLEQLLEGVSTVI